MTVAELIAEAASLPAARFLTGGTIPQDCLHDELPGGQAYAPEAVFEAESTEEVSKLLAACNALGMPVTVRGAGTGRAGGAVAIKGGLLLSLRRMDSILDFDAGTRTLRVQSGALLQAVKAEAESRGLRYPPDPGEKTATIGGNAATDASGPSALKYGTTRDYIEDAVIVLADGTVARLSDSPEYAAVPGSEGTLAVITELSLKLTEKPECDVTLLLPFADAESCIRAARQLVDGGFKPAAAEYIGTDMVEFSGRVTGNPVFPVSMDGERPGATLMLTLEGGSEDELDAQMEAVAEMAEELECLDILVADSPTLKREIWAAHDAFHTSTESAKSSGELNVNIPPEHMAKLAGFAREQAACRGLTALCYGHAGSGGLHIHAVSELSGGEYAAAFSAFSDAVYRLCAQLGGDIAGEYGVGYARRDIFREVHPDRQAALAAAKARLDPKGTLNPGKAAG